jgi:hypothetical protein
MSSSSLSMTAPPDADEDFDENTKSSGGNNKKSIRKRLGLSKTRKTIKKKKSSKTRNTNNYKRDCSKKTL